VAANSVRMTRHFACVLFLGALVGCSSSVSTVARGPSVQVSRADFGRDWPLTVSSGTLSCKGNGKVTFETGGTVYAVNGMAGAMTDLPSIELIWRDDYRGREKDMGPLIERGLALCHDPP
jgi:hypothetical protein